MCHQFTFHHQFGNDTGRSKFEQETDSILSACGYHVQNHKDPDVFDLNVPRRAQYLHNAWKKHQDAVYWVDVNLAIRKGLTFYQTRSNAIILQGILPACCILKVVRLKTGEVLYEKAYMSPRPPPKISLRHDWTKELGSKVVQQPEGKVARQPEGEVARQAKFFQPTQPIPSPNCDRSGHQKYKGRIVLRGDIVKDDSGSYAVFTAQGSSASQMTAAKIMDIIFRLPGCDGQAADAVSAYTQVKNGRCSQIEKNSQIGVSRHLDSSTMTHMA